MLRLSLFWKILLANAVLVALAATAGVCLATGVGRAASGSLTFGAVAACVVVLVLLFQRRIVTGLTAGAVKG